MHHRRLVRERLVALMAGCLLVVFLGELGVRLTGVWARWKASTRRTIAGTGRTILCLGESTTFIGGDNSYPSLLQNLVQVRFPQAGLVVVNGGRPGADTRLIMQHLESDLQQFHPYLVVAMMGNNDEGDQIAFTGGGTSSARLPAIRLLRLSEYLKTTVEQKRRGTPADDARIEVGSTEQKQAVEKAFAAALDPHARENPGLLETAFAQALAQVPDSAFLKTVYAEILLGYAEHGRTEALQRSRRLLAEVLAVYPHYTKARVGLAFWYFVAKDFDQARKALHEACLEPWRRDLLGSDRQMHNLIRLGCLVHEPLLAARLDELCMTHPNNSLYPSHAAAYFLQQGDTERARRYQTLAEASRQQFGNATTIKSYAALRVRLAHEGIGLLCMQYAGRSVTPLKRVVGEHSGVWFVDTEQEFTFARKTRSYEELFIDCCYGDLGHGTALGNRILAQKVADALEVWHLADPAVVRAACQVGPLGHR